MTPDQVKEAVELLQKLELLRRYRQDAKRSVVYAFMIGVDPNQAGVPNYLHFEIDKKTMLMALDGIESSVIKELEGLGVYEPPAMLVSAAAP